MEGKKAKVVEAREIKQLVGLAVSDIPEDLLKKAIIRVQKTHEQKEQAEKAYEEARATGISYADGHWLSAEWKTCIHDYKAACIEFTQNVLGPVIKKLEGEGNE